MGGTSKGSTNLKTGSNKPRLNPRRSERLKKVLGLKSPKPEILPFNKLCASKNTNWNKWISATSTRNYMLRDPLLDWLNLRDKNSKKFSDNGFGNYIC